MSAFNCLVAVVASLVFICQFHQNLFGLFVTLLLTPVAFCLSVAQYLVFQRMQSLLDVKVVDQEEENGKAASQD